MGLFGKCGLEEIDDFLPYFMQLAGDSSARGAGVAAAAE